MSLPDETFPEKKTKLDIIYLLITILPDFDYPNLGPLAL
jgi:hypothetical protein